MLDMNKEDILEMSRKEHEKQDPLEQEVSQKGGNRAAVVAALLATVFYVIQILVGLGENNGLYAVALSVPATGYLIRALQLKKKSDWVLAIILILLVLFFSATHVHQLITTSAIL